MKNIGRYIISYGTALLVSLTGIILGMTVSNLTAITIALAVLSVLPICFFGLNIICARNYTKKIKQTKVADMNNYILRHRQEAAEASSKMLKKIQHIRRLTTAYTVAVWLFGACGAVLGGILYHVQTGLFYLCLLYSGTVFYATYSRIVKEEKIVLNESVISKEDHPIIYSIASRAAKQLGCQGNITVALSLDCNATIFKTKDEYFLQVGIILLHIMSEEELYCIFLHEFSHVSDKNLDAIRESRYNAWLNNQSEYHSKLMSFVVNLFIFLDAGYLFNYMTYQFATSVIAEAEADRDMARYGNTEAAASALLKLEYDNKYYWEKGVKNEASIYESETLSADYLSIMISRFKKAIEERHEDWDALVDKEILANNATHPTVKMRLETLGVSKIKTVENNSSKEYREEIQKVLDYAEDRIYKERKISFAQTRKEYYLDPLERITAWEQNGMPITAEDYADIISDLKLLGRNEEAEALCDRAIRELHENSSMHAYFMKGCALLCRYDESGIQYIYHAIEKNHNYLQEGLAIIGTFCCYTGREKELLEYRERAPILAQKNMDENSQADFLSKNDNLTKDDMPAEMLEEILSFIHSVDCDIIENIYLVRKTINPTFFTSAFIIHFYGGTDAQRNEIMHKIFRYLDSYPVDWQFSLFDYFEFPEIKVEKIEGSLVYSKSNNKIKGE